MKFKKLLCSAIPIVIVSSLLSVSSITLNNVNNATNNLSILKTNKSIETYANQKLEHPNNLDILIKEDLGMKNIDPIKLKGTINYQLKTINNHSNTGINEPHQYPEGERRITEAKNGGVVPVNFKMVDDNGNEVNSFGFDWSDPNNPKLTNYIMTEPFKVEYPNLKYSDKIATFSSPNINNTYSNFEKAPIIPVSFGQNNWSYYDIPLVHDDLLECIRAGLLKQSNKDWVKLWNNWDPRNSSWNVSSPKGEQHYRTGFYGETWIERYFVFYQSRSIRVWTEPFEIINFKNIFPSHIGGVKFDNKILKKLFDIKWDVIAKNQTDNNKVWSDVTIKKLMNNVFSFSKEFWWMKTLAEIANVLDRINEEIIYPNNIKKINFRKYFSLMSKGFGDDAVNELERVLFQTEEWQNLKFPFTGGRIAVEAMIKNMVKLNFPDFDELKNKTNLFFLDKNHQFIDFNISDGRFMDVYNYKNFKYSSNFFNDNQSWSNQISIFDWNDLYNGVLLSLKTHNLVANAHVNPKAPNNQDDYVYEYDMDGNRTKKKDIVIWDGAKGWWNENFINHIGEEFIDKNVLDFRLDNFRFVLSDEQNKIKNAYINEETKDDDFLKIGKDSSGEAKYIHLKYRYGAVPIDRLILSLMYDPKHFKYFNIKSNKTINELVYLDNGSKTEWNDELGEEVETYKWYVNDLVPSLREDPINGVNYDVKRIILQSLNDSIGGYVMNTNGYGKNYKIFNKVLSGIGVGDLNKVFDFEEDKYFFDDVSWKTALNMFGIKFDNEKGRYPIFASSFDNNTIYAIVTIPNWYFIEDNTHGDYEAIWADITNNNIKWVFDGKEWRIDRDFFTMAEIKPRTRMNNKFYPNGIDSNGYFLVKMNVGNATGSWHANSKVSLSYFVSNWDEIQDQLIKPANFSDKFPFLNAGVMQLVSAKNDDGSYKYWINEPYKVEETTFLKETSYWLNNWHLDGVRLLDDLNLNNFAEDRTLKFVESIRNWIRYSNKYSNKEIDKLINEVNSKNNKQIKAKALEWYINNTMLKVRIQNYLISNFGDFKKDPLFNNLLKFYGYKFEDVFMKKYVYIANERTKSFNWVPNTKNFRNDFGYDKFTETSKIVRLNNNNLVVTNRNMEEPNSKNSFEVDVMIPSKIIKIFIEQKIFYAPAEWFKPNYNPYNQSNFMNINAINALSASHGLRINVPYLSNYKNKELVKQNFVENIRVTNLIFVIFVPICAILIIISLLLCFSWLKGKVKKK